MVFSAPRFQADPFLAAPGKAAFARSTIELVSTERELAALAESWNALLSKSSAPNPFLTWEWISGWNRHFGKGKELQIFVVREEGRPIGIAPFYQTTRRLFGVPFRRLSLLGDEAVGSDHLDLISEAGFEEKVARTLARHLVENARTWDLIELRGLSERSPHLPFLMEAFEEKVWTAWKEPGEICPYLALGATWENYLKGLSASMRYTVRRKIRNLEKGGVIEFVAVDTAEAGQAALETLIDLHRKRWSGEGGSEDFVTEVKSRFHREVARSFFEKGIARLFLLKIDQKAVASLYGFLIGKRFFFYQAGFDPALRDKSVGMALMAKSLEAAMAQGWEEFDFLRGTEEYKFHWTSTQRRLWNVSFFAPGPRSALYRTLFLARRKVRGHLKKVLGKISIRKKGES